MSSEEKLLERALHVEACVVEALEHCGEITQQALLVSFFQNTQCADNSEAVFLGYSSCGLLIENQVVRIQTPGQSERFELSPMKSRFFQCREFRLTYVNDTNPAGRVTNPLPDALGCTVRAQFRSDRAGDDDDPEEMSEDVDLIDQYEIVDRRAIGDDNHRGREGRSSRRVSESCSRSSAS